MEASAGRVYEKPAEVETALRALGLVQDDVSEAIRTGDREAESCTDNDPRVLKNFTRWGKTFRGLADRLVRKNAGWKHQERRCLPTIVSADRSIAITVSSADGRTGRNGPFPKTLNPKGTITRQVVNENLQMQLDGMNVASLHREDMAGPSTWFLLYHLDRETDEIYAELSLAASVDEGKCVAEWFERILLPPIPRSAPLQFEEEDEDDIDIIIEPKG